jgi:hypothetical protein
MGVHLMGLHLMDVYLMGVRSCDGWGLGASRSTKAMFYDGDGLKVRTVCLIKNTFNRKLRVTISQVCLGAAESKLAVICQSQLRVTVCGSRVQPLS